ncbi:phosphotransferase [Aliidiomarina halalkaliphila]|uniref:Phosphotransferase n=1 Tax=Aliidiomarina halalkaliphila TaxID=2593535 RepID=A0A552WZA1_9GAMM|nr:phosphotransferase [Aliidiomarina halalkaliphila]TRW48148.1 phosphotransferase [Aliidiomarina halalkaliphila]
MMERTQTLHHWVAQVLGHENMEVAPLAGDASFRRYFRVHDAQAKKTWILVDAPPPESLEPFISLAQAYREAGVHVPAVIGAQYDSGMMLLEDFGDQLFHSALTAESAPLLYARALAELPAIMHVTEHRKGAIPPYDRALLERENGLFRDWLLGTHLQLTLTPAEEKLWERVSARMVHQALAQPSVGVHRDYHSRNLMLTPSQTIGVIDFQDAVTGPITYDAVSLLRDCYVRWPSDFVQRLSQQCRELLQDRGLLDTSVSAEQWQEWFDWMGLQRHTKASGIFARLYHRDGKQSYLGDIPNTVQYLVDVAAEHSDLADYHDWLVTRIQPAIHERREATGAM